MIEYIISVPYIVRLLWLGCGLIGYLIFKQTRTKHYKNRTKLWKLGMIIYYGCLGPLLLILSLITLFNSNKKIKK